MVIRAGVVGHPIGQSLSPDIHGAWFADTGIEGSYEKIDASPDAFVAAIERLKDEGWVGVNVTVPHKERALAIADETSKAAKAIGAANLLRFVSGRIVADNTDWWGFTRAIETAGLSACVECAVVLGAGGAAAGILYALRESREVLILNRTRQRAEDLASRFPNASADEWGRRHELVASSPQLLVNTTSLGMEGQPPLDLRFGGSVPDAVVDIVTKPLPTPLMTDAEAAGVGVVMGGLPMLVYQAVPSFAAFTGHEPPAPEAILRQLTKRFS